jgi:nucleoside-diphosphate-sugar epimerase
MGSHIVTGCAGFIASKDSELLLEEGHQVLGIDDLNDAYDVRMKEHRLNKLKNYTNFVVRKRDISNKEEILSIKGQYDAIFNLAARAGVRASVENPWQYVNTNMIGTLNLLELARRSEIPKFVLASTSSIYGNEAKYPTPETAQSNYPLQPYAASKKGAEAMCHAYHYLYGIDVSILRYFTVYGPLGRPDMVMFRFNQWIAESQPVRVNGDGNQTRGFTYIDDIARGTILALKPVGYEIFNLGGHETISINELIEIMEDMIGKKAKIEYYPLHIADMKKNQADTSKANELLNWEPKIELKEGISNMIKWYEKEQHWVSKIQTH